MFKLDKGWEAVIAVLLAIAGGFSRILSGKNRARLKWGRLFSELFISGFSGIMVFLLSSTFNLPFEWLGVVCGMAGWIGPKILDKVSKTAQKTIGIEADSEKHDFK